MKSKLKWSEMTKKQKAGKIIGLVVRLLALFLSLAFVICLWVGARQSSRSLSASADVVSVSDPWDSSNFLNSTFSVPASWNDWSTSSSSLDDIVGFMRLGLYSYSVDDFGQPVTGSYDYSSTVMSHYFVHNFEIGEEFKFYYDFFNRGSSRVSVSEWVSDYSFRSAVQPVGAFSMSDGGNLRCDVPGLYAVYITEQRQVFWQSLPTLSDVGSDSFKLNLYGSFNDWSGGSQWQFVRDSYSSFSIDFPFYAGQEFSINSLLGSWYGSNFVPYAIIEPDFVSYIETTPDGNIRNSSERGYLDVHLVFNFYSGTVFSTPYAFPFSVTISSASDLMLQDAYNNGFSAGQEFGFSQGYNSGFTDGVSQGELSGYDKGYQAALTDRTSLSLDWLYATVQDVFSIQLGTGPAGFTFGDLLFTMVSICIFGAVLKLFFGG